MAVPFIYVTDTIQSQNMVESIFEFKLWKPTVKQPIPPNKSKKYILYYIFHLLGIFKNRDYCSVLVYAEGHIIASLLLVPKYFKWPFMNNEDLQFTYVLTKANYRGKNLAALMIDFGFQATKNSKRKYWYVTTQDNVSSQRVAAKVGFLKIGEGKRSLLQLLMKYN